VLLDNGTEYVIELEDSELPQAVEVRIALLGGNDGGGADLNPRLYERTH
jgi:hypothetical protein